MPETILMLDFGSQYAQLILRRVREAQVYAELLPWDIPEKTALDRHPRGIILSCGPNSLAHRNCQDGFLIQEPLFWVFVTGCRRWPLHWAAGLPSLSGGNLGRQCCRSVSPVIYSKKGIPCRSGCLTAIESRPFPMDLRFWLQRKTAQLPR